MGAAGWYADLTSHAFWRGPSMHDSRFQPVVHNPAIPTGRAKARPRRAALRRSPMARIAVGLLLVVIPSLVLLEASPAAGSQAGESITCVARAVEVAPPPMVKLPALNARKETKRTKYRPLAWQPVCPEGQVPVVQAIEPDVIKGNPRLKPGAGDETVGIES